MIEPEFWRLLATISATMIGLVFLGTMYYLESGSAELTIFRQEMEALTIHGAQLIVAYFSTSLVLSLLQEPFLPSGVTMIAYGLLGIFVIVLTRSLNGALRAFEHATPGQWDSILFRFSRVVSWVAFVGVFVVSPIAVRLTGAAGGATTSLTFADLAIAWTVLLALFVGYWNLVQFLLFPYEVREMERELA